MLKMLRYIRFQQVVVADENYHHFPLIENSSYTDISKTDFFPLFFRTSGTYSEVILKYSERYYAGYTKRSSYTGCSRDRIRQCSMKYRLKNEVGSHVTSTNSFPHNRKMEL